jgi:hypothetical protein
MVISKRIHHRRRDGPTASAKAMVNVMLLLGPEGMFKKKRVNQFM